MHQVTEFIVEKFWRNYTVPLALSLLTLCILIQNAWICDDAYITFRTIDNFVNGYGLRWNITERVQSYTHPLWMMLLTPLYYLTREIYLSAIALSLICSLCALSVVIRITTRFYTQLFVLITLLSSKSFIDYSSSGLENPLSHLLVALFFSTFLGKEYTSQKLSLLSLFSSLIFINRMDLILIIGPALFFTMLKEKTTWKTKARSILLGSLPAITWCLFSLFYYGFISPNTAYAKLYSPYSSFMQNAASGLHYLHISAKLDPIGALLLSSTPFLVILQRKELRLKTLITIIGVVFYLIYIIFYVGGDFMSGRFFSTSIVIAGCLLASLLREQEDTISRPCIIASIILTLSSLCLPYSPLTSNLYYRRAEADNWRNYLNIYKGVVDERGYYYGNTGLLQLAYDFYVEEKRFPVFPPNYFGYKGSQWRKEHDNEEIRVVKKSIIGFFGFFAGPRAHILDPLALSDPLLARLPVRKERARIGHVSRKIPQGYIRSLRISKNKIADPQLKLYYDKLSLVTRGPLWSKDRLIEIAKLNLGFYQDLLHENYR